MGYEIRVYIGRVTNQTGHDNKDARWLQLLAMVDLLNPGYGSAIYQLKKNEAGTHVFFFAEDGDTEIAKDDYGKSLVVLAPAAVEKALAKDAEAISDYIPLNAALVALRVLRGYEDLGVVLFGH